MCVCVCSAQLEGDFEELESRLVYLEALCCQCEELTSKQHHISTLEAYQKKKRFERFLTSLLFSVKDCCEYEVSDHQNSCDVLWSCYRREVEGLEGR